MTLVIVVAAIGALVLLVSILALSRSRFADESERFRYVSDLTSKWSRQQQSQSQPAMPATAVPAGPSEAGEAAAENSIDLRDAERGARRS
ncbi:MAG TPA: hypothetical protein VFN80_09590 [Acidothermaceae bacterium]|nr:hypothetical protein [Acidothermaceae bacterium]HEU5479883.1 hypothetical protein [Candidatus Tumulicola sp.]